MKFCSQCGAARGSSDKFCGSCGTPFLEQTDSALPTSENQLRQDDELAVVAPEDDSVAGDPKNAPPGGGNQASAAPDGMKKSPRAYRTLLFALVGVGVVVAVAVGVFLQDSSSGDDSRVEALGNVSVAKDPPSGHSSAVAESSPDEGLFEVSEGCVGCTPAQLETIRENRQREEGSQAICDSVKRLENLWNSSGVFDELWSETDRLGLRLATAELEPESDLFILAKATSDTLRIINSYLTTAPKTEAEVEDFQFALDTMDSAFDATLNRCERNVLQ